MLGAPKLKKMDLSKEQVYDELLYISRERRSILNNTVVFKWSNSFEFGHLKPWMAEEEHFHLLLDSLKAGFPDMHLFAER
jgi:hypothetical protein